MATLQYGIEDRPRRAWERLLYGWQHTLVDISPFVLPLAVASALSMDAAATAELISFGLLGMGIATIIQTTVGNRLPIIQGPSATLTGTLAPVAGQLGAAAMWGAVFVGAAAETVIGAARLPGRLRRAFPPLVAGIVVTTIGLSLGQLAVSLSLGDGAILNPVLAIAVIALAVTLQVAGRRWLGGAVARGAIFISIWAVGLGVGGALGLVDWAMVASRPWLQLPRLFPYGGPGFGWQFGLAATLAVFAGYLGSMVESIGDYAATCAVTRTELTDRHIDRGITAEGVGCLVAAVFGGLPCTSYTQNIGVIATTGIASRHVVRVAGVILLLYGLCPKFGALLVALPRPVLGGVFVLVCGMIVVAGLRLLAPALESTGNQLVAGLTLVVALGVPLYGRHVLGTEWLAGLPQLGRLLVTNPVVLAVVLAIGLYQLIGQAPAIDSEIVRSPDRLPGAGAARPKTAPD